MMEKEQLLASIERFNERWSDMLGIAFNGVIGMREQLKELTLHVETLTQEVSALRQEIRELRDERQPGLFPVDKGSL
jgi:uncharacterized coiled-coil DUF342 family protein